MFLRIVKAQGGEGVQHEYVRLVEAYREHGKNKQRVVCNLGRKDLLAAHLDGLIRLLRGERAGAAPLRVGAGPGTGGRGGGARAGGPATGRRVGGGGRRGARA